MSDIQQKPLEWRPGRSVGNRNPGDRFADMRPALKRVFAARSGQTLVVAPVNHFHPAGWIGYCGRCLRYIG